MFSTRSVGVFLLPLAVLLLIGLRGSFLGPVRTTTLVLLAGLFVAPLAATFVRVTDAVYRALESLPFVVLLTGAGLDYLWSVRWPPPRRALLVAIGGVVVALGVVYAARTLMTQSRIPGAAVPLVLAGALVIALGMLVIRLRFGQMIALGLLAIVPLQFAAFYADYFTCYQVLSSRRFSGNIRASL